VPTLARLFKRPNSSVLAKMANLDGSRTNGAKHELEVAACLLGAPQGLALLYRRLLAGARDEGISERELPDFLDLEHDSSSLMLISPDFAVSTGRHDR
jgi:putative restriction endonuclease